MSERGLRGYHGRAWIPTLAAALLATGCGRAALPRVLPGGGSEASGGDGEWLARVHEQIAGREYRASENGSGLQAPNRAHNLRTWFEPTGIRVHDRTAAGSPELLRLSLSGVGRGVQIAAVAPGEEVVADEHRVEIRRPGLVEWYVNSEAGLEQGFTLAERPAGEGSLIVELAVAGASPESRGDTVLFRTTTGRKLAYGSLVVHDAAGALLPARFAVAGSERVRIAVEDAEAAYPIVIDPLLTEAPDAQLESNQTSAWLGSAVASAGDVNGDGYADVILGALFYDAGQSNEGAAFVFLGSADGIADGDPVAAHAQLESDQASGFLGASVAGAGDVNGDGYDDVIVGSSGYDAGQTNEGAAFVFLGSASGIPDGSPATAHAQLESDQASAEFGNRVAGARDVNGDGYADVIVGAYLYDAGQSNEGAAFVFLGSASGIADGNPGNAHAQLEADQAEARFGYSVASAGDVDGDGYADVIVGAWWYDAGQSNEGAAFVFLGSASGIPDGNPTTAHARLESNQADAQFGRDVASAGDVNGDGYADVIVGVRFYDAGQSDEGAAFVFLGSASGIADANPATAHAQLESNQASAELGSSVGGAGDVNGDGYADVIVGSYLYDAGQTDEGAAFVFLGSAAGISDGNPATAHAQLESEQESALLGTSVAGAGDVNGDGYADVIVGSFLYDAGEADEGAAFVYLGGASGIADGNPSTAHAGAESDQAFARLGSSVASAGDVNGDGYADVIVGAPFYDAGQADAGVAVVVLGSASGLPATPIFTALVGNQAGALFGGVASAGDVNGDGYSDVIVGSAGYDAGQADEGAAFVFLGSASGIGNGGPTTAHARLESDQASANLGASASAGDVNGDGYADVIVGAWGYDAGQADEGAAFAFLGSASGIANGNPSTAHARLESDQASANLGLAVAGAGDVNGDGYADVIVGAYRYDAGQTDEGAAFVFLGSASGIADGNPGTAHARLESDQGAGDFDEPANLGWSVASAGDVNGDGYADVIVGAPFYDAGESEEGAAFVFLGSASGIADGNPGTAHAQLESDQEFALLGQSVASAGDVNGDGYADVIVGSYLYDAGQTDEGAAFVFLGSAAGIGNGGPSTAHARLESNQASVDFGESVASAGDVNGDGFADVIVGAPFYTAGQTWEGAAFAFLGNSEGRPVLARQRRDDVGYQPVQPWGLSHSSTGFVVDLTASHPAGSGRVSTELEACPPGAPFGDASCTTAVTPGWVAVNGAAPEAVLSHTFAGLASNTLYRWRARVLHAPATGTTPALPPHGPWRRLDAQAREADIRVLPEPGEVALLLSGIALVSLLAQRRRRVALGACSIAVLAIAPATRADDYPGNGGLGFGGPLGTGSVTMTDDGTTISGTFTRGSGGHYDFLVIYVDSIEGGFSTTSSFNDQADPHRMSISGVGSGPFGSGRSIVDFPPDFLPDFAIAIHNGDYTFGGLWGLANGGDDSLDFVESVNLSGGGPTATDYSFDFDFAEIGLAPGTPFALVATYLGQHGFRSNEAIGASDAPPDFENVGNGTLTFSGYATYPLPEPSRFALLGSGALALLALRRHREVVSARAG